MAWASSCVAPRRRTSVSTSWPGASGRASAFVLASYMVAYSSAWWAGGWSCNNPGYAAFFNRSSTTSDHSSQLRQHHRVVDDAGREPKSGQESHVEGGVVSHQFLLGQRREQGPGVHAEAVQQVDEGAAVGGVCRQRQEAHPVGA